VGIDLNAISDSEGTETLVREYYTGCVRAEWRRLVRNAYHRLEFETTLHFLEKYLPPNGLVLDAGGGPGRYTLELAKRGYDMVLVDLTPANLEFARRQIKRAGVKGRVKEILEGSIVNLSRFEDCTFDAVICTGGPLSHVLETRSRQKAIGELVRVAKPGAPVLVSVMSRLSVLTLILIESQVEIDLPHFISLRDTGDYFGVRGFTACHWFLPEELREAFGAHAVEILEMAGLEGISTHHNQALNQLARDEKRWRIWLETHFQTCTHPAVVGMSEHMLIVCRKELL
jgi:SAM-dependent methyltransferase